MASPKNRKWFDLGGRHGLTNRIADFGPGLSNCETSNLTVADIGAAEGEIALWLSNQFEVVYATEFMDDAYQILQEKAETLPNIKVAQHDIFNTPLPGRFDLICFLGVLHYATSDPVRHDVLSRLAEKTNGCLLVRTGFRELKRNHGEDLDKLSKYTSVDDLISVAEQFEFDLIMIDNQHRGQHDKRLGSLAIFTKKSSDSWFEPLKIHLRQCRGVLEMPDVINLARKK